MSPGVGDGTLQLGEVGRVDVIQLTQEIIHAGECVTDGLHGTLVLASRARGARGAQQVREIDTEDTGETRQGGDRGGVPAPLLQLANHLDADVGCRRQVVLRVGRSA